MKINSEEIESLKVVRFKQGIIAGALGNDLVGFSLPYRILAKRIEFESGALILDGWRVFDSVMAITIENLQD